MREFRSRAAGVLPGKPPAPATTTVAQARTGAGCGRGAGPDQAGHTFSALLSARMRWRGLFGLLALIVRRPTPWSAAVVAEIPAAPLDAAFRADRPAASGAEAISRRIHRLAIAGIGSCAPARSAALRRHRRPFLVKPGPLTASEARTAAQRTFSVATESATGLRFQTEARTRLTAAKSAAPEARRPSGHPQRSQRPTAARAGANPGTRESARHRPRTESSPPLAGKKVGAAAKSTLRAGEAATSRTWRGPGIYSFALRERWPNAFGAGVATDFVSRRAFAPWRPALVARSLVAWRSVRLPRRFVGFLGQGVQRGQSQRERQCHCGLFHRFLPFAVGFARGAVARIGRDAAFKTTGTAANR